MANKLYVNKPGGVIVHLADGRSDTLRYGAPVPDNLADHVDPSTFADANPRVGSAELDLQAAANARAARTENGQINSSSSPVPGNYNDLDEDGAVTLVTNLSRYPESQATVLVHEILYAGNRQKVLDAATDYARISAHAQIAADLRSLQQRSGAQGAPVAPLGDADVDAPGRELAIARAAQALKDAQTPAPTSGDGDGTPPATPEEEDAALLASRQSGSNPDGGEVVGFDDESVTVPELDTYAEQHNVEGYPAGANKPEKVAFLQEKYPEGPATPLKAETPPAS